VFAWIDERGEFIFDAATIESNGGDFNNGVAVFVEPSGFDIN
jgi:hypothetical protein